MATPPTDFENAFLLGKWDSDDPELGVNPLHLKTTEELLREALNFFK